MEINHWCVFLIGSVVLYGGLKIYEILKDIANILLAILGNLKEGDE